MARTYQTVLGKTEVSANANTGEYTVYAHDLWFHAGNWQYNIHWHAGKIEKVGKKFIAQLDIRFAQQNDFYGARPVAPVQSIIGEYATLADAVQAAAQAAQAAIEKVQADAQAQVQIDNAAQLVAIEKSNADYLAAQEIAAVDADAQAAEQVAAKSVAPQAEAIAPTKKPRDAEFYKLRNEHKALCDKKLEIMRLGKNKTQANAYINQKLDVLREKLDAYAPESEKAINANWVKVGDHWRLWGYDSQTFRYSSNNELAQIHKAPRKGYEVLIIDSSGAGQAIGNYRTLQDAQQAAERIAGFAQDAQDAANEAGANMAFKTATATAGVCEAKFIAGDDKWVDVMIRRSPATGYSAQFYYHKKDIGGFDCQDRAQFVKKIKSKILDYANTL